MKLRDLPGWPPIWGCSCSSPERCATGEVGTLREVLWSKVTGLLVLTMEYEQEEHSAILELDTPLAEKLAAALATQTGRPIEEIAETEIS